ncbi:hypothetical protein EV360DRAFT_86686 [Lentinula raphanica]|nr:hypothetical protein EV360DRAFT_86686 [Lentinula raphanica]
MRLVQPTAFFVLAFVSVVRAAPITSTSRALSNSDIRVGADAEVHPTPPKHDPSNQCEDPLRSAHTQGTQQWASVQRRSDRDARIPRFTDAELHNLHLEEFSGRNHRYYPTESVEDREYKAAIAASLRHTSGPTAQGSSSPPALGAVPSSHTLIGPSGSGSTSYDSIRPNMQTEKPPKLIGVSFPMGVSETDVGRLKEPPLQVQEQVSLRLYGFSDLVDYIAFEKNYVDGETHFKYFVKVEGDYERTDHKLSGPEPIVTPKGDGGKPLCDFHYLWYDYSRSQPSKAFTSAELSSGVIVRPGSSTGPTPSATESLKNLLTGRKGG